MVTSDNYQSFMERDPSKYHVLLFTERKTTAPIFKSLSKQFKDKLLFGEVRKTSEKELVDRFKVTQFPTLLVITDPQGYEGERYTGDLKIDRLNKFLNTYSYKTFVFEKKIDFLQLTDQKYRTEGICGKRSSNLCFIFFTTANTVELLRDQIKPLLELYKNDPVSIVWVDKYEEQPLHQQFNN